jgi:hypothetical protein
MDLFVDRIMYRLCYRPCELDSVENTPVTVTQLLEALSPARWLYPPSSFSGEVDIVAGHAISMWQAES